MADTAYAMVNISPDEGDLCVSTALGIVRHPVKFDAGQFGLYLCKEAGIWHEYFTKRAIPEKYFRTIMEGARGTVPDNNPTPGIGFTAPELVKLWSENQLRMFGAFDLLPCTQSEFMMFTANIPPKDRRDAGKHLAGFLAEADRIEAEVQQLKQNLSASVREFTETASPEQPAHFGDALCPGCWRLVPKREKLYRCPHCNFQYQETPHERRAREKKIAAQDRRWETADKLSQRAAKHSELKATVLEIIVFTPVGPGILLLFLSLFGEKSGLSLGVVNTLAAIGEIWFAITVVLLIYFFVS